MRSRLLISGVLVLLLPWCMRVTDGIEVDVSYQPAATPAQIRTDLGYRVALDRALLVVGQVELIRCDNFVAELWRVFAPARAKAHVLEAPTSLGEPLVLDLMESVGGAEYAGTMKPPPGRYCGVRVVATPAGADAVGLTSKDQEMMANSVLVEGRVQREPADGVLLSTLIEGPLPLELSFEEPLGLDRPGVEYVTIQINHRTWFDGIDFAQLSSNEVQERVTDNVRASLSVVLPDREDDLQGP